MKRWKTIIFSATALLFMPFAGQADPIGYNFSQGGFVCFDELYENDSDSDSGEPSTPCDNVPDGAELSVEGMFFGEDLDEDGFLDSDAGELTGFMMALLVDDEVDFEIDIADVEDGDFFLSYELGSGIIGDNPDEAILFIALLEDFEVEVLLYLTAGIEEFILSCELEGICGLVAFGDNDDGFFGPDSLFFVTDELAQVSPKAVSEPGTLLLLGAGLIGIGLMRRRRHT